MTSYQVSWMCLRPNPSSALRVRLTRSLHSLRPDVFLAIDACAGKLELTVMGPRTPCPHPIRLRIFAREQGQGDMPTRCVCILSSANHAGR